MAVLIQTRCLIAFSRPLWLVPILSWAMAVPAFGQADEYAVKAAFLYNFAKLIEWPAQAFHSPEDPICICILGQDPFGDSLLHVIWDGTVAGRHFLVNQIKEVSPKSTCQILFVGSAERKRFQSMAGSLKGLPILTVGESPGFAAEGGAINFKLEGGKVRLEINPEAVEEAHLRISPKLLNAADVVRKPRTAR